jgi:hypothetical protein
MGKLLRELELSGTGMNQLFIEFSIFVEGKRNFHSLIAFSAFFLPLRERKLSSLPSE